MRTSEPLPAPERAPAPAPSADASRLAVVVVDDAERVGPGQLTRTAFLARVRAEVVLAVDAELAGTGRTAADCPLLPRWLGRYAARPASTINQALRRFLGGTPASADAAVRAIAARARMGAAVWRRSGMAGLLASGLVPLDGSDDGDGRVQNRGEPGGAPLRGDPQAVRGRLGAGRALEPGVRARMERGLGADLSGVRIHDDAAGAGVARGLSSLAVTVGQDVSFADGAYRPGTPAGDVLLAHELVHTLQQRGSTDPGHADGAALEHQADAGAVAALARLWAGRDAEATSVTGGRGLRLSACAAPPAAVALAAAGGGGAAVGGTAVAGGVTLFGVTLTATEVALLGGTAIVGTALIAEEATRDRAEPRTIDIAPPLPLTRERPRPPKPLRWNPTVKVSAAIDSGGSVGGLDFNLGAGSITVGGRSADPGTSSAAYSWQGHHTWPLQYGGSASQPLLGVRQALHQGVIHPLMWTYLNGLGHDVSTATTDPKNVAFIASLRRNPDLRRRVATQLLAFYATLNTQADPPMPPAAYAAGVEASLRALGV